MKRFNSKQAEGYSPYTCIGALQQGNAVTRLSALVLGLGNMLNGQLIKGLLFFGRRAGLSVVHDPLRLP